MGEPHPMVEDMAKRTAKASRSALGNPNPLYGVPPPKPAPPKRARTRTNVTPRIGKMKGHG